MRITPTYEKWSLHRVGSEQPLHTGEHSFDAFCIARGTAPQRDFTTGCRSHFFGHETEPLDTSWIVAFLFINYSRRAQPGVELPPEPFDDERGAPGPVVAPTAYEALPLTCCNLAQQQRARTTIVGQGGHELFCEGSRDKGELVDDRGGRIKEHLFRVGGNSGTAERSAHLLAATELMAVRTIASETGENVIDWKCGKISERHNPEVSEHLGQLWPMQYFDRLCPQECDRCTMFDNALFLSALSNSARPDAIRLRDEHRDKWAIPDTNQAAHLLSERVWSMQTCFSKRKWRSCQNGRDRSTYCISECNLAAETTGGAPCRESRPSWLAKRYFNTERLERPDYVFEGPNLIGWIAGQDN